MISIVFLLPLVSFLALLYALLQFIWIKKQNPGDSKMISVAKNIANGAVTFLKAEYKVLACFVLLSCLVIFYLSSNDKGLHPLTVVSFVGGAVMSALSGWIGMKIATQANVRTAQAAKTSLSKAFKISFIGGSVMGMGVTGLALLGLGSFFTMFYLYFFMHCESELAMVFSLEPLIGFSLGAESVALFARVAGGIYTKAADVGADIVGKLEAGIPEDDPRNPATIADNVGDNVGDVAGMGADLFGSYVATMLSAMVLGSEIYSQGRLCLYPILLPIIIGMLGIVLSLLVSFFTRIKENGSVLKTFNRITLFLSVIIAASSYFIIQSMFTSDEYSMRGKTFDSIGVFYAVLTGLIVGITISYITEYFTAIGKRPVLFIVKQSNTGHATNIIAGLSVGMISTALPILVFAAGIYFAFYFSGFYGVAMAASGMMSTTALQLSVDAFGPIADNAGGISEMCGLPKEVRDRTDVLDAAGNTTAATGKGFAIASAALTSLALFAAYAKTANIAAIDIYKAPVLAALFVGGMVPFLFSALTISAVGKAAMSMVTEVRRQFKEIKGIMNGDAEPEYEKCIAISTKAALGHMLLPGILTIVPPILIGFIFGPEVLGGFLAGVTVSGTLMAIFQSNSGGAWDNAKKSFEKGVYIDGQKFYKGSDCHKASITGDTVGDPFKDTSGPSMNILIKLASIVALVIAPLIANTAECQKEKIDPTESISSHLDRE